MGPVWGKYVAAILAFSLIVGASFSAGWTARGWKDSVAALETARQLDEKHAMLSTYKDDVLKALDARIEARNSNRQVVERIITKEVEKPVYKNVCLADEGREMIDKWAKGEFNVPSTD